MATMDIQVPDIGDFDEVAVIELLVKPGDTVKAEQSLITVESDKASMEIPSSHAGVVKELKVKLGDKVKQGSVVLTLEGEGGAAALAPAPAAAPAAAAPVPAAAPVKSAGGRVRYTFGMPCAVMARSAALPTSMTASSLAMKEATALVEPEQQKPRRYFTLSRSISFRTLLVASVGLALSSEVITLSL